MATAFAFIREVQKEISPELKAELQKELKATRALPGNGCVPTHLEQDTTARDRAIRSKAAKRFQGLKQTYKTAPDVGAIFGFVPKSK